MSDILELTQPLVFFLPYDCFAVELPALLGCTEAGAGRGVSHPEGVGDGGGYTLCLSNFQGVVALRHFPQSPM